jgi:hypothetical protein
LFLHKINETLLKGGEREREREREREEEEEEINTGGKERDGLHDCVFFFFRLMGVSGSIYVYLN